MGQRRTEVLHAAIELLDEVGLDGLTMRVLASRLGVRAGALYRHYPSKQALLDAMVEHLAGQEDAAQVSGSWDERLRIVATGMREVMLSHRDGARLMSTFRDPGAEAVQAFLGLIAALVEAGVSEETAVVAVDTVMAYVNGFTTEEQSRGGERRDQAFREGFDLIITGIRARTPGSSDPHD